MLYSLYGMFKQFTNEGIWEKKTTTRKQPNIQVQDMTAKSESRSCPIWKCEEYPTGTWGYHNLHHIENKIIPCLS